MSISNKTIWGNLFALGATLLWSGNFIVARELNETVPPISLAFFRWAIAVLAFTPFAIKQLSRDFYLIKTHFTYFIIVSIIGVTIFNTLIYLAARTTSALNLSLISLTFPIFTILIARIVFKEPITSTKFAGIILVLLGVTIMVTKGQLSALLYLNFSQGDLWMLLAAFIFAVYSFLIRKKPSQVHIISFQYSLFVLGLFFLTPFYLWESSLRPPIEFTHDVFLPILYLGICASLISYLFWNSAILYIGPSKSAMIYYLMPVFSGFLAWILLHEALTVFQIFSGGLILSGILILKPYRNKNRKFFEKLGC